MRDLEGPKNVVDEVRLAGPQGCDQEIRIHNPNLQDYLIPPFPSACHVTQLLHTLTLTAELIAGHWHQ